MKVLATDTSTSILTVGICEDDAILGEVVFEAGRTHSEKLLETVDRLLKKTRLELRDIDLLAVTHGPGSFTGLRIGIATWKGLALGAGLGLLGVSTLDSLARAAAHAQGTLCVLLDAKLSQVFAAVYEFDKGERRTIVPETVCRGDEILDKLEGPVTFVGDGAQLYADTIKTRLPQARILPTSQVCPRASAVAAEALDRFNAGVSTDPGAVEPVYLRQSQAEDLRDRQQQVISET